MLPLAPPVNGFFSAGLATFLRIAQCPFAWPGAGVEASPSADENEAVQQASQVRGLDAAKPAPTAQAALIPAGSADFAPQGRGDLPPGPGRSPGPWQIHQPLSSAALLA